MSQEKSLARTVLQRATKIIAAFLSIVFVFQFLCLFYFHKAEQEKELQTIAENISDTINFYHGSGDLSGLRRALSSSDIFKNRPGELIFKDRANTEILKISRMDFAPYRGSPSFIATLSIPIENDFKFSIGTLTLSLDQKQEYLAFFYQQGAFLILLLSSYLLFSFIFLRSTKAALLPLNELKSSMITEARKLNLTELEPSNADEITFIKKLFAEVTLGWQKDKEFAIEQQRMARSYEIAKQVVHDIRSPLSALGMLEKTLTSSPTPQRVLLKKSIQRIREISKNLLETSRQNSARPHLDSNNFLCPLVIACQDILNEKNLEFAGKSFDFRFSYQEKDQLATIRANPEDFKRVLSNLINNAVESYSSSTSKNPIVNITLSSTTNLAQLAIEDQGEGIPTHILNKLGLTNISFAKKNGNGIGVHHAVKSVKAWGGDLTIDSTLKKGTTVQLSLPLCFQESLVSKIEPKAHHKHIVIVEDDQIFADQLERLLESKQSPLSVLQYKTPTELRHAYDFSKKNESIFLLDHDFEGQLENGFDLFKSLDLQTDSTYLVSNRYDDYSVLQKCSDAGLKVIPKTVVNELTLEQMR
ncbi:HAMP domain-containing histidine kinase [bacterium]|nr:HAMP domain-containing histidine kinase [bacterium]